MLAHGSSHVSLVLHCLQVMQSWLPVSFCFHCMLGLVFTLVARKTIDIDYSFNAAYSLFSTMSLKHVDSSG